MSDLTNKEKELNKKLGEVFLYEYGQEYTDKICDETDALHEKYKDLEIPDSLDKWFDDFSVAQKVQERKHRFQKKTRVIAKRVAIFIVALLIVSGSLTFGVEAFRLRFFNIFFVDNDTHTDLAVLEGDSGSMEITKPEDWTNYYFPTWLPEGYDLEQHNGVEGYRTIRFSNGTTAISMYEIKGETGFDSVIDTEDAISDYLLINNYDAIYVFKNETSTIAWLEGDTLIKLIGPIKKAEIMKIAKNIKIIN